MYSLFQSQDQTSHTRTGDDDDRNGKDKDVEECVDEENDLESGSMSMNLAFALALDPKEDENENPHSRSGDRHEASELYDAEEASCGDYIRSDEIGTEDDKALRAMQYYPIDADIDYSNDDDDNNASMEPESKSRTQLEIDQQEEEDEEDLTYQLDIYDDTDTDTDTEFDYKSHQLLTINGSEDRYERTPVKRHELPEPWSPYFTSLSTPKSSYTQPEPSLGECPSLVPTHPIVPVPYEILSQPPMTMHEKLSELAGDPDGDISIPCPPVAVHPPEVSITGKIRGLRLPVGGSINTEELSEWKEYESLVSQNLASSQASLSLKSTLHGLDANDNFDNESSARNYVSYSTGHKSKKKRQLSKHKYDTSDKVRGSYSKFIESDSPGTRMSLARRLNFLDVPPRRINAENADNYTKKMFDSHVI